MKAGLAKWKVPAAIGGALAIAVGLFVARGDRGDRSTKNESVVEAPAAVPDGLLGEFSISTPNASWTKLQRGIGGAAGILPTTLPGVIVALLDLDVTLADELDGTAPMFGALAGDPADPAMAVAIKLVDARRARGLFADGDAGRYRAKDVPGMTILQRNRPGSAPEDGHFATAITKSGFFLVGRREADLTRLGLYVTRTLASRPASPSSLVFDIPRSALDAQLRPRLETAWKDTKSYLLAEDRRMRAERGRAPDFGDPAAIVATVDSLVTPRIAVLGALDHVRITLDVTDEAAAVRATLTPGADATNPARSWIDGMKVGDAAALLALPASSTLAASMRDGNVERTEQARAFENAVVSSLGPRLKQPDKLHEVIESATNARGEIAALAVSGEEPPGVFVRAPVRDGAAANRAIRGAFELARAEPFKDLLHVKDLTATTSELPGIGKSDVMTLSRLVPESGPRRSGRDGGAPPAAKAGDIGMAWTSDPSSLSLGAGAEPLVTLKLGAKPDRTLADEPTLKRFLGAIGTDASTVLVLQPLRLDPKRANLPPAPLGIALGKKDGAAVVWLDVSDALLREGVRWQMGF